MCCKTHWGEYEYDTKKNPAPQNTQTLLLLTRFLDKLRHQGLNSAGQSPSLNAVGTGEGKGAIAHLPRFGRSVNPIQIRGAD